MIHLMGFAREWNLGPEGRFSEKTIHLSENASRFVGVVWLITCMLLLVSTFGYYSRKDWFWVSGITGVIISQTLIILYWPDAKWGTIVNVIFLVVIIFAVGRITFNTMVRKEVNNLISSSSHDASIISAEEVSLLPGIIQKWLRKSNAIGRPMPASVHIKQNGFMRTTTESEWMSFDAEQYFTIDPPGFVWNATIHADKIIDIVGCDKYENGKGNMLIKAVSLIPLGNSSGKEIDQGSMIRYMAEIIWFPYAAVSDYLDWEEIDSTHARVTMRYNDITASGIYTFNKDGLPIGFEAQRYGEFNGKFSKEIWSVATTSYRDFESIPIGTASEVTWKLKDRDFMWLKLIITDIEYH
jgi:hypothetical protein